MIEWATEYYLLCKTIAVEKWSLIDFLNFMPGKWRVLKLRKYLSVYVFKKGHHASFLRAKATKID